MITIPNHLLRLYRAGKLAEHRKESIVRIRLLNYRSKLTELLDPAVQARLDKANRVGICAYTGLEIPAEFLETWPLWNDCPEYPVPHPTEPRAIAYMSRPLWSGVYGYNRRDLVRHLLEVTSCCG